MKNQTNIVLSLDEQLDAARRRIEVHDAELDEAKVRRSKISTALKRVFPGSRVYVNGSVAHGDALTPLTDIDVGVVVKGAEAEHGPGRKGPIDLKERAAAAIREELKADYPRLVVIVEGQKRSILVRFGDPVTPGQTDFTADVIVAVDNPGGEGLFIPRYSGWDRSHPEKHTELVHEAISNTAVVYARVVRLVKHWNRRHDKPICSWNAKALALGCITEPTTLLAGLTAWFAYAEEQLTIGETEDPAKVAPHPIKMRKTKTEVLRALGAARVRLARAVELENAGYPVLAHSELAKLFNDEDMLPAPGRISVEAEQARLGRDEAARLGRDEAARRARPATPGRRPGVLVPPVPVRSWAP